MTWLLLIFDISVSAAQKEGTVRSKVSRFLQKHSYLIPLQQSVYAFKDSPENRQSMAGIVEFFQKEFGDSVNLLVFEGETILGFNNKDVERVAGAQYDVKYKAVKERVETVSRNLKKKIISLERARGLANSIELKLTETMKHDKRETISTDRQTASNVIYELQKELSERVKPE
jgi:CRISPR/Cas system-associated endoribonuclease Cas2